MIFGAGGPCQLGNGSERFSGSTRSHHLEFISLTESQSLWHPTDWGSLWGPEADPVTLGSQSLRERGFWGPHKVKGCPLP